jgi:hypothetical protein
MIAKLDSRRRLVLPAEFPPNSSVTIYKIDADTLILRRGRGPKPRIAMLLPDVKKLPRDTE